MKHRCGADTQGQQPELGSCGFHLSKVFPWTCSLSPSCCRELLSGRGLPPCKAQSTEPRCCWGGSVFLLESQMLAACQAKGELGSTCSLEAPPDECSGGRRLFPSFKGRGGREEWRCHLEMNMRLKRRCAHQPDGWGWSPGSHILAGRVIFSCRRRDLSPWDSFTAAGIPRPRAAAAGQGAALAFPPSGELTGGMWKAGPPPHGCRQQKLSRIQIPLQARGNSC